MHSQPRIILFILSCLLLAACESAPPSPTPTPTPEPGPTAAPTSTPLAAPVISSTLPSVIVNEPLAVVHTLPAYQASEAAFTRDSARIVVQFNHPVVPATAPDMQALLPQPLVIEPAVQGAGEWTNTTVYAFTPAEDLRVATTYTVSVRPLRDVFGMELRDYAFSFKTTGPAVLKAEPERSAQFAPRAQAITLTFNTPMDATSVESRFSLAPLLSDGSVSETRISGKFEWQGTATRFRPDAPLDFNTAYQALLAAGAQDATRTGTLPSETRWTFRTLKKLDVTRTFPNDGESDSRVASSGVLVQFNAPMNRAGLKFTVTPSIANPHVDWQDDSNAYIRGDWQPFETYTLTISAESRGRDGDLLARDVVVRFTAALPNPTLYLNVPGPIGLYDAHGSQLVYATHANLQQIDYRLYKVERGEFVNLMAQRDFRYGYNIFSAYRPAEANKVREWSLTVSAPYTATRVSATKLASDAPLPTGIYYLEARAAGVSATSRHLLVMTGVNLALKRMEREALVWVTDLQTGKPVAQQPLALYGPSAKLLASGQSDADGVFRAQFTPIQTYEPLYVLSEVDGRIVAVVGGEWNNGLSHFDFNLPSQYYAPEYYVNLYSDRPVYRPGQTVYFRGIVRRDDDAQYSLPSELSSVSVVVRDGQGREIATQGLKLDRFGAFDGQLKLSDSASTGYYSLQLQLGDSRRPTYSSVQFVVAEYRRPEFQIELASDKSDYVNGETIKLDAKATYFFGGPVSVANVHWRLFREDLFFRPPNLVGWWQFRDYDWWSDPSKGRGFFREGKGKTDSAGHFHLEVPADVSEYPYSQNLILEVEVTDLNDQPIASRVSVPVHKGGYYIGLRPQRYLSGAGQERAVDIIALRATADGGRPTADSGSSPPRASQSGGVVSGQRINVSLYERKWYSALQRVVSGGAYWTNQYSDTLIARVDVLSDEQGRAVAKFTPPLPGSYHVVAEGKDARGNTVHSGAWLWVWGNGFVNWRQENHDRIQLVADKPQYAPGESAEVLIPAPFADAEALLTIERGSIREVKRLSLQGNSQRIQLPIRPDYAPNVFVSVMLVKGRSGNTPAQFKLGYLALEVATAEKELQVKLTADCGRQTADSGPPSVVCRPQDNAKLTLEATDSAGQPVEAEFSLALVDKAVLSLVDDTSVPLLKAFYTRRGLSVQTSSSLMRSVDRLNDAIQQGDKGGGGGDGADAPPVRRDFRDTAYWNAHVTTDAAGRAQLSITLPDNLTTWSLTAKGVSLDTRVGEARTEVISTKDLLLRPVTPRFFVQGDQAQIGAVLNNNSSQDISAQVRLDAQGLALIDSSGEVSSPLQMVTVKAHDQARVSWSVAVSAEEKVVVRFTAVGGALNDAVEYTLPIQRQIAAETVVASGQVETKLEQSIKLPADVRAGGELFIQLSPSLAAASRAGLKYLQSFEYECSEQTTSKFFPNAATYGALKQLGIERDDLRRGLEANISKEIQRLYALQNQDGGWGWWRADGSNPMLTAYALLGLHTAQQSGLAVNQEVMNRAERVLLRYLDSRADNDNERAFVLFVLTEMGRNHTGRLVNLFEQRAKGLQHFGKAYLLMAMHKQALPQAQTLIGELSSAATLDAGGAHWEEAKQDYYMMNTNTRSTALAIMALARTDPNSATLASAVRWLMAARRLGRWETTQETAWSVLALTEFMLATGELKGNFSYRVSLNNTSLSGEMKVTPATIDQAQTYTISFKDLLLDAANELSIERSAGEGRLYYNASLRTYLPFDSPPVLDKGLIVGRQYFAVDPQTLKPTNQAITSAQVGDYVQVKLLIVASKDVHYLAVEDPLPAGLEAIDTLLQTTSRAAERARMQRQPSSNAPWYYGYWDYWVNADVRDDKLAIFATYLRAGTYEYAYLARASVAGEFHTLPARAWPMYDPAVFGRNAATTFTVTPP